MPRTYKPDPFGKRYVKHNEEDIKKAVEDIKKNKISYRVAQAKYGISRSVLFRRTLSVEVKKQGGQTVLSPETEKFLVQNLNICAELGYPLSNNDLRMIVKSYLDKKGENIKKFKQNLPGNEFVIGFLKRHKDSISQKFYQRVRKPRAAITADNLEILLQEVPSADIINCDGSNLSDDSDKKK